MASSWCNQGVPVKWLFGGGMFFKSSRAEDVKKKNKMNSETTTQLIWIISEHVFLSSRRHINSRPIVFCLKTCRYAIFLKERKSQQRVVKKKEIQYQECSISDSLVNFVWSVWKKKKEKKDFLETMLRLPPVYLPTQKGHPWGSTIYRSRSTTWTTICFFSLSFLVVDFSSKVSYLGQPAQISFEKAWHTSDTCNFSSSSSPLEMVNLWASV